jgi:hypothetical protein
MPMGFPPQQQQPKPSFPAGPGGLPYGASMPPDGEPSDSPLIAQLMASLQSGDPYTTGTGPDPDGVLGMGDGTDPNMSAEQLLQLLALGQAGVGGGPQAQNAGQSGVDYDSGLIGTILNGGGY